MQSPSVHSEAYTSFGSQIVLNNRTTGAPKHAACMLFVVAAAADVLAYKDGAGNITTITFTAAYTGPMPRCTYTTLETTTTCDVVVAYWMSDPG